MKRDLIACCGSPCIASVLGFNGPMHTRYLHIIIIEGTIGNSLSLGKAL